MSSLNSRFIFESVIECHPDIATARPLVALAAPQNPEHITDAKTLAAVLIRPYMGSLVARPTTVSAARLIQEVGIPPRSRHPWSNLLFFRSQHAGIQAARRTP